MSDLFEHTFFINIVLLHPHDEFKQQMPANKGTKNVDNIFRNFWFSHSNSQETVRH